MKKIFVVLALAASVSAYANLIGNGYYRVQNYGTSRWANLVDNQASVDFFAGTADLHSLQLNKDTEEILSDPGSIVLITNVSGNQYDVAAQGVSLSELVDRSINIRQNGSASNGEGLYYLYGTYKGATKYIGDASITDNQYGTASLNVSIEDNNKWFIMPISAASDNYFGVKPTIKSNEGLFTTTFASFAYQPYSSDVKIYYVGRVGYGMVELIEVNGAVPPGSAVVIKCAGENTSDNRMELVQLQDALPNNALIGVYFDFLNKSTSNQVVYDSETMRVLGVLEDGSLGFVTSDDLQTIPSNSTYIKVPAGSLPSLKCVTTAEYDANMPQAPEGFYFGEDEYYEILPQGSDTYSGTFDLPKPENGPADLKIRFNTASDDFFIGAYSDNKEDVVLEYSQDEVLPFEYNSPYYWILPNWNGGDIKVTINLLYQYVSFYSKNAGIKYIHAGKKGIVFDGTSIYCKGASEIEIYDTTGKMVEKTHGESLDVTSLQKGVYLVKADGETLKIAL